MTYCIFKSPVSAAFFGLEPKKVIAEAAEYLLEQLPSSRLRMLDENREMLPVYIRCAGCENQADTRGFFIELSTYSGPGEEINHEPHDLIPDGNSHAERLKFAVHLVEGCIDTYTEMLETDEMWGQRPIN